ncbi:MAG: RNA methyltransferase, partial [Pseudomonadota bacterium]|nr:RNA methyltransferase [Pseudomonadota bacterium]
MKVFVDRIGARGDGIAVTEGGSIYIPDALPGEWVRIGKIKHRRGVARAEVRELLEASPARVTPGCFHYNKCGGCVGQHLGKELYAAWKQEHVERVLLRAGLKAQVLPVLFVPIGSRRRVRMEFRVVGDETLLGFREAGSAWIVDVNDCI